MHDATVTPGTTPAEELRDPALSMTRLLQVLKFLEADGQFTRTLRVGVSSSITAELLGTYLRKHAAVNHIRLEPVQGNYDDSLGDMERFAAEGIEQVVLLYFLDSLMPSLETSLPRLDAGLMQAKEAEFQSRMQLTLAAADKFEVIYISTLHRVTISSNQSSPDAVDELVARLNAELRREAALHANVRIIDTQKLITEVGAHAAFDARFYFRSMAPYTARYFDAFAAAIASASRGFGSYFFKMLALDCDNTLWGGIVGEEGVGGLQLAPYGFPGNIYWRAQNEIANLEQSGVLLCLCTKNNPGDVEEVFSAHPSMVLRPSQIVARRVNWSDKAQNLRELAAELDLGLDSIVFLDDSDFECNAVRSQLPQVRTYQVPKNLPEYALVLSEISRLFLAGGVSVESRSKTKQYQQRSMAVAVKAQFGSQEEYLRSLNLRALLALNAKESTARISELSQKSNQFNLTTRRYSEREIVDSMSSADTEVYSLVVLDRFGDAGLTGVVIMRYMGRTAHVESFFMSCRVIGRGVEFSIWEYLTRQAAARGCDEMLAQYKPTARNSLVERFFDELGMQRVDGSAREVVGGAGIVSYRLTLPSVNLFKTQWIDVIHA